MAAHGHLDESTIPGTVHLVDLEGVIKGKHAATSQLKDVVLVPAPSSDPDDPLNWSPKRKWLSTVSQSVYTLMVGIASAAIYSVLVPISDDTGLTLADLNAGTGYMFLFFVSGVKDSISLYLIDSGLGVPLLASSRASIWKAACVSVLDASDISKSTSQAHDII
jgi:hypothetical protein